METARVWWGDNGQLGWWLNFKNSNILLGGIPLHVMPEKICENIKSIYNGNFLVEPPPDCHCRFCSGNETFKIKITKPIFFFRDEKMPLILRIKKVILLYFFPDLVLLIKNMYGGYDGIRDASHFVPLPDVNAEVSYLCDISHVRSQIPLID